MISIVCVYNNKKILSDYLLNALKNQTSVYELILIDNTEGQYKSATNALNCGGKKAKGKYIMFVHQDVDLCSPSWLEDTENILDSVPNLGIAGVAGMSENGRTNKERGRNIILSGDKNWEYGNPIQKPELAQTLDECLAIIPKYVFDMLQFDEIVCDNWHLYVVDYCLSIRKLKYCAYAIPMYIQHKSRGVFAPNPFRTIISLGKLPTDYYQTMGKILEKHSDYYERIYTTCGDWSTSYPVNLQRIVWLVKNGLNCILDKFGCN